MDGHLYGLGTQIVCNICQNSGSLDPALSFVHSWARYGESCCKAPSHAAVGMDHAGTALWIDCFLIARVTSDGR